MRRVLPTLAVALLAAAGCGASPGDAAQPAPSATASVTPAAVPATTPVTPAPPSAATAVAELPESELHPIRGTTYQRIPGADQIPAEMRKPEALAGYISRQVMKGASPVGNVQLFRLQPEVTADESVADEVVQAIFEEFAATTDIERRTVDGRDLLLKDRVRGEDIGAVTWREGDDVVLIATRDSDLAVLMARAWIADEGR